MRSRLSVAAVIIVLTTALASCSSAGKTDAGPSAATNAEATTAAGSITSNAASTTAAHSSTVKSIDVCTAVPPATVVQLTGKQYTVATPGTIGVGTSCAYDDVDNTDDGVTLSYATSNAETTWQAVHTGNVTDMNGVGDKAFWDNSNTLYAVWGATIVQINGLNSQSASAALAKALLAALH